MRKSLDYVDCSQKFSHKIESTGLNEKASLGSRDAGLIQRSRKYFDNIDSLDQGFGQSNFFDDYRSHVNLCHQRETECPNKDNLIHK